MKKEPLKSGASQTTGGMIDMPVSRRAASTSARAGIRIANEVLKKLDELLTERRIAEKTTNS